VRGDFQLTSEVLGGGAQQRVTLHRGFAGAMELVAAAHAVRQCRGWVRSRVARPARPRAAALTPGTAVPSRAGAAAGDGGRAPGPAGSVLLSVLPLDAGAFRAAEVIQKYSKETNKESHKIIT